jgi:hypothetical protein
MELENFKYNLSKLKKCNQYWDEMIPMEGGRLCAKCDKKIVDFSTFTFTDIAHFYSETKEPICGFYLPEQVKAFNNLKSSLPLALGLSTLIATNTSANSSVVDSANQILSNRKHTLNTNPNYKIPNKAALTDSIFIKGVVYILGEDNVSKVPISYASIIVKGTKIGTVANNDGAFSLRYLPLPTDAQITIIISSVGVVSKELTLNITDTINFNLGEILFKKRDTEIISFWVTTKKRSKLSKFWRKITKIFR